MTNAITGHAVEEQKNRFLRRRIAHVACGLSVFVADASAATFERVTFDSAAQQLASGKLIPGDRIEGDLAKPKGADPYPAVIALHGCAGMHEATKQKLATELAGRGYVLLLVDSYKTRDIDPDRGLTCSTNAFATFLKRRPDAYGALLYLTRQSFVDPRRVALIGFSAGAWQTLAMAEPRSFEQFVPQSDFRFRAAAAFYPPCKQAVARPAIPTLIFIGALDDWTPAAECSDKVARWGNAGPQLELIVYPGAYHGFYYPHLRRGMKYLGHWIAYNGDAARNANIRLLEFLDHHLR